MCGWSGWYDARAEGVNVKMERGDKINYISPFRDLWNDINASRGYGWEMNPWVWAVSFGMITPTTQARETERENDERTDTDRPVPQRLRREDQRRTQGRRESGMSKIEPKGCYDLGNDVRALLFEETIIEGNGGDPVTMKRAELWDCDGNFLILTGNQAHDEAMLRQVNNAWRAGYTAGSEYGAKWRGSKCAGR